MRRAQLKTKASATATAKGGEGALGARRGPPLKNCTGIRRMQNDIAIAAYYNSSDVRVSPSRLTATTLFPSEFPRSGKKCCRFRTGDVVLSGRDNLGAIR